MPHPNPVIDAIENGGHYMRSMPGKEGKSSSPPICRADGEPWECTAIKAAKQKARERKFPPAVSTPMDAPRSNYSF